MVAAGSATAFKSYDLPPWQRGNKPGLLSNTDYLDMGMLAFQCEVQVQVQKY